MQSAGRMARLKVVIPDKPGNIARLAKLVADQQVNILEIYQHHEVSGVEIGETQVDMVLEAKSRQDIDAVIGAIDHCGYKRS